MNQLWTAPSAWGRSRRRRRAGSLVARLGAIVIEWRIAMLEVRGVRIRRKTENETLLATRVMTNGL